MNGMEDLWRFETNFNLFGFINMICVQHGINSMVVECFWPSPNVHCTFIYGCKKLMVRNY